MSNLVPEKRMDRIGRLITRWVRGDDTKDRRNAVLGTVMPVIPPSSGAFIAEQHRKDVASHAELSKKIHEALNDSVDLIVDSRLMYVEGVLDREMMKKAHVYELGGRIKAVVAKLPEYETETLQVVYDRLRGTQRLLRVLENPWDSEIEMRETVHFSTFHPNGNMKIPKTNYFQPIREGLFDVNSLSEFPVGSAEYEAIQAALEIINFDYWEFNAKKSEWHSSSGVVVDVFDAQKAEWAEPEKAVWLTRMALEHPGRMDDIKQYLLDRKVNLNDVDGGHLEEYLSTAAPVLADGAL